MKGYVHAVAGLGAALTTASYWPTQWLHGSILVPATIYAGAIAPDRLEMGIIPHRTLTHWTPMWIGFSVVIWWIQSQSSLIVALAVSGFSAGCVIHISGDALTPMGVPTWHPFKRRSFGAGENYQLRNGVIWTAVFWMPLLFIAVLDSR